MVYRWAICASWLFISEQKEGHFWNQDGKHYTLKKLTHPNTLVRTSFHANCNDYLFSNDHSHNKEALEVVES